MPSGDGSGHSWVSSMAPPPTREHRQPSWSLNVRAPDWCPIRVPAGPAAVEPRAHVLEDAGRGHRRGLLGERSARGGVLGGRSA